MASDTPRRLTRAAAAAAAASPDAPPAVALADLVPPPSSTRKRKRSITLEYDDDVAGAKEESLLNGGQSAAKRRVRVKADAKAGGTDASAEADAPAAAAPPPAVELAAPVRSRFFSSSSGGGGCGSDAPSASAAAAADVKPKVPSGMASPPRASAAATTAPHVVPATVATASPGRRAPTHDLSLLASASPPPMSRPGEEGTGEGSSSSSSSSTSSSLLRVPNPFWREHYTNILAMRARRDAPVDSMGCERCADPDAPPPVRRFQALVGLMLSSQTKDEVTFAATKRLIAETGCSPSALAAIDEGELDRLISSVGFHRNKARFLKATAGILLQQHGGDVPSTLEGLLALPGVGPKMATIAMHACWGTPVGIGVDVHVHRVTNRLGWVRTGTKTPEDTRQALQDFLPREMWGPLNIDLVGFGQQVCTPLAPSCHVCLNAAICPVGAKLRSADAWRGGKK